MSADGPKERPWDQTGFAASGNATDSSDADRAGMARREVLKALGITSAALAFHALMPREWCGPVVELTRLPAHAATSANCDMATLTAVRESNGQVTLRWTGASGAIDVYRQATGEAAKKIVGIVDADISTFLDATANAQTGYTYTFQGTCKANARVEAVR